MVTLNEVFSSLDAKRRYEVWFLRFGLSDGSGAWWFRYLLINPGRSGCVEPAQEAPVQVWATWFPAGEKPQSLIQGFPLSGLALSPRNHSPFHFRISNNAIEDNACQGALEVDGHAISWSLRYRSTFRVTMSNKGWIGFSRTPHSDAVFSGQIRFDGRKFAGDPLGFGLEGHNGGYRHRSFWTWTHVYFPRPGKPASTLEALVYEMPFGLVFRKAVLCHEGLQHVFPNLKETGAPRETLEWSFQCNNRQGIRMQADIDGRGAGMHRLAYLKTDCSGSFAVRNNSLATASLVVQDSRGGVERLETGNGAVLEMVG